MNHGPITLLCLATLATVLTSFAPSPYAGAPTGRYAFVDVSGTLGVKDSATGLTWMKNELAGLLTPAAAKTACASATPTGWRLPTIMELADLVDETRTEPPLIDIGFFEGPTKGLPPAAGPIVAPLPPSTPNYVWTSTPFPAGMTNWGIFFDTGIANSRPSDLTKGAVRCVR